MNISNYRERKGNGLIELAKVGDSYAVADRRFDSETGEEVRPTPVESLDIEKLRQQLDEVRMTAEDLETLIIDLEAL